MQNAHFGASTKEIAVILGGYMAGLDLTMECTCTHCTYSRWTVVIPFPKILALTRLEIRMNFLE